MTNFDFTPNEQNALVTSVQKKLDEFYNETRNIPIGREFDRKEVQQLVEEFDLDNKNDAAEILERVIQYMREYAVHTPHQSYYGLFNPRPGFASILADYISATFNPQLAAWSHAPFANEVERRCINELASKMGFEMDNVDGTFCSGGAESNLSALLCALNHYYPDIAESGLMGIDAKPSIYVSAESHHSIHKAAKVTSLGLNAIRTIKVNDDLSLNTQELDRQIEEDVQNGYHPLMIAATAGTTGAGAIDNVQEINTVCKKHSIWLHVDAAYGAGLKISSEYGENLGAVHLADSMTIDLHKWFSVPMGASVVLVNHPKALAKTFAIRTDYMPDDDEMSRAIDPYTTSIQWSRRAIGLKIFLPLAIHGWKGYSEMITAQIILAKYLRDQLMAAGWIIKNDTILPIVCFTHKVINGNAALTTILNDQIVKSGQAWCSTYPIHGELCIRACIINYATTQEDIDKFIQLLNEKLNGLTY